MNRELVERVLDNLLREGVSCDTCELCYPEMTKTPCEIDAPYNTDEFFCNKWKPITKTKEAIV